MAYDNSATPPHQQQRDTKLLDIIEHALMTTNPPKLSNSKIAQIAATFIENLHRTNWMLLTPSLVGDLASVLQRCEDIAEFQMSGKVEPAILIDSYPVGSEIENTAKSLYENYSRRYKSPPTVDLQKERLQAVFRGTRPFAMLLAPRAPARKGLEAMFASAVTGTWTAFEAMAGDLWEVALNIHPSGLAELKGTRKSKSPQATQGDDERENRKTVPLAWIVRHQFDVGSKMGTILRDRQRTDSLAGIREAYRSAFYKKFDQVDAAIDDASLDAIAAVRNLIIHRAGVVDEKYEQQSKYLDIPAGILNQSLVLNGADVVKVRQRVIATSLRLLSAVDDWIVEESKES